jgi:DNA invertase Pin-like site-specific DNA recombinase
VKWAIYSRVSTSKQENENQLTELREFANKQGWTVGNEYVDVVTGSGKRDRPQFDAMMLAASQHKFDGILFWKLDRLSRAGVRQTLTILSRLDGWGVGWRSFQEQWFDSCGPFKDAVISIMATLAEQERIAISERTKLGLKRARREGKRLGRPTADLDIAKVKRLQSAGMSLREISAKVGWSPSLLCKRLASA